MATLTEKTKLATEYAVCPRGVDVSIDRFHLQISHYDERRMTSQEAVLRALTLWAGIGGAVGIPLLLMIHLFTDTRWMSVVLSPAGLAFGIASLLMLVAVIYFNEPQHTNERNVEVKLYRTAINGKRYPGIERVRIMRDGKTYSVVIVTMGETATEHVAFSGLNRECAEHITQVIDDYLGLNTPYNELHCAM